MNSRMHLKNSRIAGFSVYMQKQITLSNGSQTGAPVLKILNMTVYFSCDIYFIMFVCVFFYNSNQSRREKLVISFFFQEK